MGWKNVKEFYNIRHIVQMIEGELYIGSPYVNDILIVDKEGVDKEGKVRNGSIIARNKDLERYRDDISKSPDKFIELMNKPDEFKRDILVYIYHPNTGIVEKKCEEKGWPNVTHDGQLMYDNIFYADVEKLIEQEKNNLGLWIERKKRAIKECEEMIEKHKKDLDIDRRSLDKLNIEYTEFILDKKR